MSSEEGKDWIRDRVAALAALGPVSVLDIGPGVGTYARLLANLPIKRMVAVEAWEPYIRTYHLDQYYDEIIVGDARAVELPVADVVILGDVIEHMTRREGQQLWHRCGEAARCAVFLSIPIVHYPQAEIEGNPFEVHIEENWSHELVLNSFKGIGASWQGKEVGVYERRITTAGKLSAGRLRT